MLKVIIAIFIIFVVGFCMLILFVHIEEIMNERPATEAESIEVEAFINSFYDFLDTSIELESVKKWYLNNDIQFYIQNNAYGGGATYVVNNSEKEFHSLITTFFSRYGKKEEKELEELYFEKYPYDKPIEDLFVVKYNVIDLLRN